jgi:hypothetical protein
VGVSRKPPKEGTPEPGLDDAALQAFVGKGGSAAVTESAAPKEAQKKDVRFTLVIPSAMCSDIDQIRARLPGKVSRHQWVIEAIYEKIERDRR